MRKLGLAFDDQTTLKEAAEMIRDELDHTDKRPRVGGPRLTPNSLVEHGELDEYTL